MRRTNRLPLEQLSPYLLEVPEEARALTWRDVFGNDHPIEIEVGFGKGLFLVTSALAQPDVNFVGIEIMRKYQLFTATRMAKRGLKNVRLAKADARLLLRDRVAAGSVQAMHVYFPDPWWKKRHHKRRVFTAQFARECERVLHGRPMHIATDVEVLRRHVGVDPAGDAWPRQRLGVPERARPADDDQLRTQGARGGNPRAPGGVGEGRDNRRRAGDVMSMQPGEPGA